MTKEELKEEFDKLMNELRKLNKLPDEEFISLETTKKRSKLHNQMMYLIKKSKEL